MDPIASNGRIEVLTPKDTPFAVRTTIAYESARAPESTGIGERGVREWKGGGIRTGPDVRGQACIFGGLGGAGAA